LMKKKVKVFKTCVIKECKREKATGGCEELLNTERELAVESLKAHLSEQRHDFFNLLQVLYGYTQLKKYDKVLAHIKDYCRQLENIGRLYNCKCIKLADLLYTKDKEAESVDLNLEVLVSVSFEPVVRKLDNADIVHILDNIISVFLYALDSRGCKNTSIYFELEERADCFRIEVYCKELREGSLASVSLDIPEQVMYWKKIDKRIMCTGSIMQHCCDSGYEAELLEDGTGFLMNIRKM
jgi:hypothetical protein